MDSNQLSKRELNKMVFTRLIFFIPAMMIIFFLPAGTLAYWHGWVYIAILFIPFLFVIAYFLKNDPALLERRMRMREKEKNQKLIVKISTIFFLLAFILPGLDYRWGWSRVPLWLVLAADVIVFASYMMVFRVFRENSFAARTVEVDQGQKVISSGLYARVRHPMYTAVILMYLATPLALGSWWSLIPSLFIIPTLVLRILDEENVLARDLPGYAEYVQKVRWRLLPGIW